METAVYFIRHALSDQSVRDGRIRPLTPQGYADAPKLIPFFAGIPLHRIYSSPYRRAVETVMPLAESRGMPVWLIEDFRERLSDSVQTMPMDDLIARQWNDFTYTLSDGETLAAVQWRNIEALRAVLAREMGNTIAIGTHGMALCTILRHFDPALDIRAVEHILGIYPCVVRITFSDGIDAFQACQILDTGI